MINLYTSCPCVDKFITSSLQVVLHRSIFSTMDEICVHLNRCWWSCLSPQWHLSSSSNFHLTQFTFVLPQPVHSLFSVLHWIQFSWSLGRIFSVDSTGTIPVFSHFSFRTVFDLSVNMWLLRMNNLRDFSIWFTITCPKMGWRGSVSNFSSFNIRDYISSY